MGGSQNGFTLEAGINKGRGNADGSDTTNVSTKVRAGNTVNLDSGGDTTLKGATVTGNTVAAKVGGDLNVESLQDTSKYDSKQQSAGLSVSVCVPPFCYGASTASGNVASSKVKGDFASVTEQSGIKAGDGGFDVAVKGNTDLKGGVIESSQKAIDDNKNRLTTGTLTQSSIQNHDNYDASGFSVSGSVSGKMGDQTPTNSMSDANRNAATSKTKPGGNSGISSNSGSQGSTTISGISGGALTITNDDAQRAKTGQSAAEAVASVNRDVSTDKDTSGALTKSWDGGKLMQQTQAEVQITAAFGSAASKAIGDYGDLQLKQAQALRNAAASEPDADKRDSMLANAQSIENKWGESGTARVGAHALVGGITGGLQGALGAGTSAALASSLNNLLNNADLPEPLKQSLGAALASAAGALVGGGNGAAAAFNEDVNNRQLHSLEKKLISKLASDKANQLCAGDSSCLSKAGTYWTDLLEKAALGLVDDQAYAANLRYLTALAQTASVQGTEGAMGAAQQYLNDYQAALAIVSARAGQVITANGQTTKSYGTAQTYFSATDQQRADSQVNVDFFNQQGSIVPNVAARDADRLERLSAQNGAAQPIYPAEEILLGNAVGNKVLAAAGRIVGELDLFFTGTVTSTKAGTINAGKISSEGLTVQLSAVERTAINTIDSLPNSQLQGDLRELVANSYFQRNGFTALDGKCGSGNCFDGVYIKGNTVYINEVKPLNADGTIKLTGAKGNQPLQMSDQWIEGAITRLRDGTESQRYTAEKILEALDPNSSTKLVKVVSGINADSMVIAKLK